MIVVSGTELFIGPVNGSLRTKRFKKSGDEMKLRLSLAIAAAAFLVLSTISTNIASAAESRPLKLCNKSSTSLYLTVGYFSPGAKDDNDRGVLTGPFVSRGYWQIDPGKCETFENPFNARYMFWFGFNQKFNANELAVYAMSGTNSPVHYCLPNYFMGARTAFTFERENISLAECQREHQDKPNIWAVPRQVDTWVDPTVNFAGE